MHASDCAALLRAAGALCLSLGWIAPRALAAQSHDTPRPSVLQNVRLAPGASLVQIVLRDGRIQAVLPAEAEAPVDAWRIDGAGHLALPAFLDACATAVVETPVPVADQDRAPDLASEVWTDMRSALRKGIAPSFRASEALSGAEIASEAWEKLGFGALLAAPSGEFLAGQSAWLAARGGALRERVILDGVAQHASFHARGGGYPEAQMGAIAQLRQFLLDASRQRELERRFAQGRPGARPPVDAQLAAAAALLDGRQPLVFAADRASEIETWLDLCAEFRLRPVIFGGREAWRISERLAREGVGVLLTLDWGKEPAKPEALKESEASAKEDSEKSEARDKPSESADAEKPPKRALYREPEGVVEERHRLWRETRDGALRLEEVGVRFGFASGAGGVSQLRERVLELLEAGLPPDAAQRALTTTPAELLGLSARLGAIAPGFDADIALWTRHPLVADPKLAAQAQLAWLIVDGHAREFTLEDRSFQEQAPDEGVDLNGAWTLELGELLGGDPAQARVELTMKPTGSLEGHVTYREAVLDSDVHFEVRGHAGARRLEVQGEFEVEGIEVEARLELELDDLDGPWRGELRLEQEGDVRVGAVSMRRAPGAEGEAR